VRRPYCLSHTPLLLRTMAVGCGSFDTSTLLRVCSQLFPAVPCTLHRSPSCCSPECFPLPAGWCTGVVRSCRHPTGRCVSWVSNQSTLACLSAAGTTARQHTATACLRCTGSWRCARMHASTMHVHARACMYACMHAHRHAHLQPNMHARLHTTVELMVDCWLELAESQRNSRYSV
jgi:hypothetical protein